MIKLFIHNIKEMFFAERFRWFLWSPVLFSTGIGIYFSLPFEVSKWIVLLLLEVILFLAFLFRHNYNRLFVLFNVFLMVMGFATACLQTYYLSKKVYASVDIKSYITASIEEIDYNYRGKQRLVVDDVKNFDGDLIKGRYRLTMMSENDELKAGDCIEAVAEISTPDKPFVIGGYQPKRQAFFDDISGIGYIPSSVFALDECSNSNSFGDFIANLRQDISRRIYEILPHDQASVVTAISTGDSGKINVSVRDNYRDSGLAHFLSISGLHMSMITGLMFFFIRFITASIPIIAVRVDSKKISAIVAIFVSFLYLMISGAAIPAQRAFIMTTIVLLGVLFDRVAISMRVLAIAAFIILIIAPQALIGPSFQMSFSAVIALVAFYEKYAGSITKFLKGDNYQSNSWLVKMFKVCWVYIIGILLTDFVASVTTSVFASYHFNRLAVYTTLGNMLAGPVIGFIIMPFLLFSLLLMPFGLEAIPLKITGFGVSLVNDITKDVASLPNASVQVLSFPTWSIILMVLGGLWLCIWQEKWRRWGWVAIAIGFLGIFTVNNPDIIVNNDVSVVAVKANNGDMVIFPGRGNNLLKKVWREKTASPSLSDKDYKKLKEIYSGEKTDDNWIDMICNERYCDYKEKVRIYKSKKLYDIKNKRYFSVPSGGNIIIDKNKLKIKTIDEYIGNKLYNK